jgi:uncharacterized repeat protein (TIGR01451 family)
MKKLIAAVCFLSSIICYSQSPGVRWNKTVRTFTDGEAFFDIKATPDRGYIAVGADSGWSYFKPLIKEKRLSSADLGLISKLDSAGNVIWTRSVNGFLVEFSSVALSGDGGYVAVGHCADVQPLDTSKFYIVKVNAQGNIVWEKKYGGTLMDDAVNIIRTSTGSGFVVVGNTRSNDGDVTGNHGPFNTSDIWMMKIDNTGNIVWKKCFGGSGEDFATCVIETPDKYFFVTGKSNSIDGDLNGNNGGMDAFLFKTDSLGNTALRAHYGGVNDDEFKSFVHSADSTLTIVGYTKSAAILSNGYKGAYDLWFAKISLAGGNLGTMIMSKGFGGSQDDIGMSIIKTQDNGFVISGYTESNNNDVVGHSGLADSWLIKVSNAGNLVWQKCVGTVKDEFAMATVYHSEADFTIAGLFQVGPSPGDITDAFVAKLGNSSVLRADFTSPFTINQGLLTAVKIGAQFSGIPVNNRLYLDVDTGQYTVSFNYPHPYYNISPPSVNVNLVNYFDTAVVNFTVTPIPGRRDLTISAIPLSPARPGFTMQYKLIYKNVGTDTVASGQVLFKRDSRINFNSATPSVSSINGDTLKWNYSNLKPFDSSSIIINMTVQPLPAVNIGDTLTSIALILPLTGDLTPADDSAIVRQRVTGGYDPNDKTENLGGKISAQQVTAGGYINYIIRFQNTGNDTAFNIIVRDTLDSKLDWNSFNLIASSHPYVLQINSNNRLAFSFNNIKLVDSVHNEPASHGFIAYRIKPKNNLLVGDTIKNSASIYFDYNLPVKTNIQQTIVVNNIITGISGPQPDRLSLSMFPNPTGEIIWLRLKDQSTGLGILRVIDMNGKEIYFKNLGMINSSNFTTSINLSKYTPGLYTILLGVGKKVYSGKLILQ